MSRIDEALRRLTGGVSAEPRKPHSLDGFASEGEVSHKADESRRQAKIEPRKLAPFVVSTPAPVEARVTAPVAAAPAAVKPAVEVAVPRSPERVERFDADPDVDKLIDVRQVTDYAGFVFRSIRRHKMLSAGTFLGVLVVAGLVAWLFPRSYHVEVKLLAQRNAVMTALSNPGRAVPWDADAPTRAAAETVLRRDNLISLISQTDLINEWDRRRPFVTRVKDWVTAFVTRYELTPEDKLDVLVWRLETYMAVDAGPVGDGTVTIELSWPDAEMAYRIVERARQAFLDARQAAEMSAISESISILQDYSQTLHDKVNRTLTTMAARGGRGTATTETPAPRPRRPIVLPPTLEALAAPVAAADGPAPNPDVARLATLARQKREELDRLEAERQTALATAQATLALFKTTYTPQHPSVQNAQQKVDALTGASPQIAALRTQLDELDTKYEALYTADRERIEQESAKGRPAPSAPARAAAAPVQTYNEPAPAPAPRVNPAAEFANLTLRTELGQYQSILERTDGARIELAVSEAAFKYRYTVIKPAQVPREPESPNLRLMAVAGLLAAILLSIGVAVAKDILSNRIVEPWQVERQLGLPILGNVRLV